MASREHVQSLFMQHIDLLRGLVHALVGNLADAEDIVQEVFLLVVDKSDQYEEGTDFGAWIRTIARFQAMQHAARRQRRRQLAPDVIDQLCTEAAAAPAPEWDREIAALRRCLERLAPAAKRILSLRYEGGMLPAEIAAHCGRSVNGVTVTIAKARSLLRACVERHLRGRETAA